MNPTKRSRQVAAPLLAAAALELLAGCHTYTAISPYSKGSPVTTHTHPLETQRGGFGSNFGPILLGSAVAYLLFRFGAGE